MHLLCCVDDLHPCTLYTLKHLKFGRSLNTLDHDSLHLRSFQAALCNGERYKSMLACEMPISHTVTFPFHCIAAKQVQAVSHQTASRVGLMQPLLVEQQKPTAHAVSYT